MKKSDHSGRWQWPTFAGIGLLAMSGMCVTSALFKVAQTYSAIARSTSSPRPSELAEGVLGALYISMSAPMLFVAGLILLLIGLTAPSSARVIESL